MNNRNYQKELDKLLAELEAEGRTPRLFLHSCCAPCSSYVLEYLSRYFEITVFFYNPNISPARVRKACGGNPQDDRENGICPSGEADRRRV